MASLLHALEDCPNVVVVDARCRDMTNGTAKAKHEADPGSVELCDWHEVCPPPSPQRTSADEGGFQKLGEIEDTDHLIPYGVYTIEEARAYGISQGTCPYFTIRRMVSPRSLPLQIATSLTDFNAGAATTRERHHLLFPLSPGSKSCRTSQ